MEQAATRQQDLLPIRYGRMAASPFAFLRGAAAVMAADLAASPVSGLRVQVIGDAHISNFGVFASPERRLVFDVNDFDETLPAPWEWDVKRLVASVAVAARGERRGQGGGQAAAAAPPPPTAGRCTTSPRKTTLDVWYAHLDVADIVQQRPVEAPRPDREGAAQDPPPHQPPGGRQAHRARGRQAALQEPAAARGPAARPRRGGRRGSGARGHPAGFLAYRDSLAPERRLLLDRFRLVDVARKVVGVGSVGTRCFVVLLVGRDDDDPLVLQFKEATRSVLEPYAGRSDYRHRGARVVHGQRLVQLDSDVFLGWNALAEVDQHYYWRQLRDMKASAEIAMLGPRSSPATSTPAPGASRTPTPVPAIPSPSPPTSAGASFDKAMAAFATAYAAQTRDDWEALKTAIADGRVTAISDV